MVLGVLGWALNSSSSTSVRALPLMFPPLLLVFLLSHPFTKCKLSGVSKGPRLLRLIIVSWMQMRFVSAQRQATKTSRTYVRQSLSLTNWTCPHLADLPDPS